MDDQQNGQQGHREITIQALIDRRPFNIAEDKRGHEVTLGAKFPKGLARVVDVLRYSPATPYQTNSDVIRDATSLGLDILKIRYQDGLGDTFADESAATEVASQTRELAEIQDRVRKFTSDLEMLERDGDGELAIRQLHQFLTKLVPSPDRWRVRKYLRHLREERVIQRLARDNEEIVNLLAGGEASGS